MRLLVASLSSILLLTACMTPGSQTLSPDVPLLIEGRPAPVLAHNDQIFLLQSSDRQLASNKVLVFDMWRTVWNAGQTERADDFLSSGYKEHSLLRPDGLEGFKRYHGEHSVRLDTVPDTITDPVVTIIAEDDLVGVATVEYYLEPDDSGNTYTSTRFDLFRIEDGLIAEHWDSGSIPFGTSLPAAGEGPLPITGAEELDQYPMLSNNDTRLANNKRLAFDLWRHTSEAGREEMALLYLDPGYIQHNPNAATGREGFMGYFTQRPDTSIETWYERPLIALIAEGDLVMQVLKGERRNPNNPDQMVEIAWFDMFRVRDGRLIEHWDNAAKGEVPRVMENTFVDRPE